MSIFNKIFKPQKFTSRDNSTFLDVFGDTEGMYRPIKTKQDIVWAYKFCPTIRAIIDKKAELFSNFVLKEMRGEVELQNTPFLNIMNSPHPFYSENEFFQTLSKQWDLFGEVFIWKISNNINAPLKNGDKLLILPAQNVHIEINENYDLRFDDRETVRSESPTGNPEEDCHEVTTDPLWGGGVSDSRGRDGPGMGRAALDRAPREPVKAAFAFDHLDGVADGGRIDPAQQRQKRVIHSRSP
jgi:hypothetical protein